MLTSSLERGEDRGERWRERGTEGGRERGTEGEWGGWRGESWLQMVLLLLLHTSFIVCRSIGNLMRL